MPGRKPLNEGARAANSMLLDLHNHTRYSPDSRVDPAALVGLARKIRLAGIATTDHHSVRGIGAAEPAAGPRFLGVPATEIPTQARHVLRFGDHLILPP